jgi:multisubunit Na+/H+ antiporter MnhF subunit
MKNWEKGSEAMVAVNAIFAGFSGALVAIMIATEEKCAWTQTSITLGLVSVILFALAAERITDALDESRVNIYLCSMLIYNIAVVLLFFSVALFLFSHGWHIPSVVLALGTLYPWLIHICWFLFCKGKRKEYIDKICKEA